MNFWIYPTKLAVATDGTTMSSYFFYIGPHWFEMEMSNDHCIAMYCISFGTLEIKNYLPRLVPTPLITDYYIYYLAHTVRNLTN